ncbi:hypothetical protein HK102_004400, partial [Quaeritorhiza haematococci]
VFEFSMEETIQHEQAMAANQAIALQQQQIPMIHEGTEPEHPVPSAIRNLDQRERLNTNILYSFIEEQRHENKAQRQQNAAQHEEILSLRSLLLELQTQKAQQFEQGSSTKRRNFKHADYKRKSGS